MNAVRFVIASAENNTTESYETQTALRILHSNTEHSSIHRCSLQWQARAHECERPASKGQGSCQIVPVPMHLWDNWNINSVTYGNNNEAYVYSPRCRARISSDRRSIFNSKHTFLSFISCLMYTLIRFKCSFPLPGPVSHFRFIPHTITPYRLKTPPLLTYVKKINFPGVRKTILQNFIAIGIMV